MPDNTLSHIAGNRINISGRVIQRCSLCGAKLCDSENASMPLNHDGTIPEFPTWPPGRFIQVEIGNPIRYSLLPDGDKLPDDNCLEFV